jgi:hypothetical protein
MQHAESEDLGTIEDALCATFPPDDGCPSADSVRCESVTVQILSRKISKCPEGSNGTIRRSGNCFWTSGLSKPLRTYLPLLLYW